MFKVPITDTDTVSVHLLSILNNVLPRHLFKIRVIRYIQRPKRMVRTRKIKVKSIQNEEIIMTMTMTITVITYLIIIIMMRMRIKLGDRIKQ